MDLAVGAIVEGKVTGITKFGAFVALPEGKSGMVHISEVASTFVNDIKDFLQEGQQVKAGDLLVTLEAMRSSILIRQAVSIFRSRRRSRRSRVSRDRSAVRAALRRVSRVSSVRPHRADVCSRHRRTRPR